MLDNPVYRKQSRSQNGPTAGKLRYEVICPLSHGKGLHGRPILLSHIRQYQLTIDSQTLLRRRAAEGLQLRTDDTRPGQTRDELLPEQTGTDPLRNARGQLHVVMTGVFSSNRDHMLCEWGVDLSGVGERGQALGHLHVAASGFDTMGPKRHPDEGDRASGA
jgi:hypothetical protein